MIGYDIFRILEKRTSSMIACVSACLTNLTHTDIHRHTQTHTQTHTHTDTHTQTHTHTPTPLKPGPLLVARGKHRKR